MDAPTEEMDAPTEEMDAPTKSEKPYKVKKLADDADVTPNCIYQMIARGELEAVRFGRAIRIPRHVGDRMLKGLGKA